MKTLYLKDIDIKKASPMKPKTLRRIVQQNLRRIKEEYVAVLDRSDKSGVQQWLTDNYYVIESESKAVLLELKHMDALPCDTKTHLPLTYLYAREYFLKEGHDVNYNAISTLIEIMQEHRSLDSGEFAFLPVAIKITMLQLAYYALFETRDEQQAPQLMMRAVVNLKDMISIGFAELIDKHSVVEQILSEDPAGVYSKMDTETKNYYRHLLYELSQVEKKSERELAETVLNRAKSAQEDAKKHVGYYLLHHPKLHHKNRTIGRLILWGTYILALAVSVLLGWLCSSILTAVLLYIPLTEVIKVILETVGLRFSDIGFIPRMDIGNCIPKYAKTLVVISVLLPKASEAAKLGKRLEKLLYSNGMGNIDFCVLADFGEASYQQNPFDHSQAAAAVKEIERLNSQYGNRFMLLIRNRTYNRMSGRYSGWERKRGAITELVRMMHGEEVELFGSAGDLSKLSEVKYLLALDSDTELLMDTASKMVAAALHPLNKAVVDHEAGIVKSGYGIFVPKIATSLDSAKKTVFSIVMAGTGGATAYDTKSREFYQDLFGESIFSGKGLIDADVFYELLDRRFPENRVLSHDILEGCYLRTAFLSDVELVDSFPSNLTSWLSRLHRWIRGDWQNIRYLGSKADGETNRFSALSRYKLFDNLRRSAVPVLTFLAILVSPFVGKYAAAALTITAFLSVTFAQLLSAVRAVASGGMFSLSRKYYAAILPLSVENLLQALFNVIMLPAHAIKNLDAIVRSLYRMCISKKRLLEWMTASEGEKRKGSIGALFRHYLLGELSGVFILLVSPYGFVNLFGVLFLLLMPFVLISSYQLRNKVSELDSEQKEKITAYAALMWEFYCDYCTAEDNYLPPDNMQETPVRKVAHRTSPTNIGMYMLSILAARDLDFIDTASMCTRLSHTLDTIDRLEKWHGNLYNWYDTKTLELLQPAFVSAVDSGNFACCMVALKEGIRDYAGEDTRVSELAKRIGKIADETDLSRFYNKQRKLISIGFDTEKNEYSKSYYDFLMSEARMTSYFAVAKRMASKKHWGTLSRVMSKDGSFAGPVSWTGTMFEYFMPHLLLPAYGGSLLDEALRYCIYCQQRRVKGTGIPWGISESAFFTFDATMNYQYKAHGVQKLGIKQDLDKELVVSPYSTFLTLPFNPQTSYKNLMLLEDCGAVGPYGFYEAVDYTTGRRQGKNGSIVRSYMAHHIGMSLLGVDNCLFHNRMQERFMRDHDMQASKELLEEKIAKDTVVFEEIKRKDVVDKNARVAGLSETYDEVSPVNGHATILSNGQLSAFYTDAGISYLAVGEDNLTKATTDTLRLPKGIYAFVASEKEKFSVTSAPFYRKDIVYSATFSEDSVEYLANARDFEAGMKCTVHALYATEQRQIVVHNKLQKREHAALLIYLEPSLIRFEDDAAHPVFSQLFVQAQYDRSTRTLVFSRKMRSGKHAKYLAVGFLEEIDFDYETSRDKLMRNGYQSILDFADLDFEGGTGTPDCIGALRVELSINAGAQKEVTFLSACGETRDEAVSRILRLREQGSVQEKRNAPSPIFTDSLEGRTAVKLLPKLLYPYCDDEKILKAIGKNQLSNHALWPYGISGDLPIVLAPVGSKEDADRLEGYLLALKRLRLYKVEFDLVIPYWEEQIGPLLQKKIERFGCKELLNHRGGIFLIYRQEMDEALDNLLLAKSVMIVSAKPEEPSAPVPFHPAALLDSKPLLQQEEGLTVYGGTFADERFYADRKTVLPFCNILANPTFGTLVSDRALGCSWAINSRENKLTPWNNDVISDNKGEMLLMKIKNETFDLISGSSAVFEPNFAFYAGEARGVRCAVRVTVPGKGCAKQVDVLFENTTDREIRLDCAYYTEPVLGVNRRNSRLISPQFQDGKLLFYNPFNTAVKSHMALSCDREEVRAVCDRVSFLNGNWEKSAAAPCADLCGALVTGIELPPKRKEKVRFVLSYGMTERSAEQLTRLPLPKPEEDRNRVRIQTPDAYLDHLVNTWLPWQTLGARVMARIGFYQAGGAYGFRDQLQDVTSYLLLEPKWAKRQILRCAAVQFEEGDVLHWWHVLPKNAGGLKGVRTRYSDDLLWLPYAVCEYVEKTGDKSILDIETRYLSAPVLQEHEHELYLEPGIAPEKGSVYEHCLRAIEHAMRLGEYGLPLMGSGDWNDGYNTVGAAGRGQSVWLAMFLIIVLERFSVLCQQRSDDERAQKFREDAEKLRRNIDENAWDGDWYLRAFYDDLSKMGTHEDTECKIDSLPQSFAVLCGMPDKERVNTALSNAWRYLVDEKGRVVKLFTQAFDKSSKDPGYVKAYPKGVRENGGQYTHGAIWSAMALLENGDFDKGYQLLQILNPAYRCSNQELAERYKLEPYYIAADIYTGKDYYGRGGWSIYTGSAGWYYRTAVESLLGVYKKGDLLELSPRIPSSWDGFQMQLTLDGTQLDVSVRRGGTYRLEVDGKEVSSVHLDGGNHAVELQIA